MMKFHAVIDQLAVPNVTEVTKQSIAKNELPRYSVVVKDAAVAKQAIIAMFPNEHNAKWYADERNGTHKTLQQAAKEAIMVQDACNLGGVSISFREAVQAVQQLRISTAGVRTHPIIKLFIDKMFDLCGRPDTSEYSRAMRQCEAIARGESIDHEAAA
jgi:hypothetical protein